MPLILALEPDERQAAILSGVIMNQLRADLVLVDSKEAAVAAMTRELPDLVLLASSLPRTQEKEIIGRLRVRDELVQTLSIPPLSAPVEQEDESSGLLRAFRRKRQTDKPVVCDPKAFAREIRTRLRRIELARARQIVEQMPRVPPEPVPAPSPAAAAPPVDPWSWAARAPIAPPRGVPAEAAAVRPSAPPPPAGTRGTPAPRATSPLARPSASPVPPPFFATLVATYERIGAAARDSRPAGDEPAPSELAGIARGLRIPEAVALFTYPRACRIERVLVARRRAARHEPSFPMASPTERGLHAAAMA